MNFDRKMPRKHFNRIQEVKSKSATAGPPTSFRPKTAVEETTRFYAELSTTTTEASVTPTVETVSEEPGDHETTTAKIVDPEESTAVPQVLTQLSKGDQV